MEVKLIRLLSTINKFYIFFLLRSNVYIVDFEQTLYLILAPLRRFLSGLSRRMWNGSSSCLFLYVKRIALNPLSLCETITLNYNDAFTKNIRQLNILGFTYTNSDAFTYTAMTFVHAINFLITVACALIVHCSLCF